MSDRPGANPEDNASSNAKTSTPARTEDIVVAAALELFQSYGLSLVEREYAPTDVPKDHDIAATIGFTSPQMQGAMLLTSEKAILARTRPRELGDREPTEREVCDWAGELVNQLLGRVKNRLATYGLRLEQSTPTVIVGSHVHRAPPSTNVARRYFFVDSGGAILLYFDASVAGSLTLLDAASPLHPPAAEGELYLF